MRKLLVGFIVLTVWTHAVWAGEKGWFGFGADIKVDGILSPTLVWVKISKVEPASPAAQKGVAVGDEILQVDNTDVPGHKARELKPLMQKQVGETLHLRLKHANGETYSAALIAVQPPK